MIVEGYSVDLYCENEDTNTNNHWRGVADGNYYLMVGGVKIQFVFAGKNRSVCLREARRFGWKIRGRKAFCPVCAIVSRAERQTE